jgi:hypothetical protein
MSHFVQSKPTVELRDHEVRPAAGPRQCQRRGLRLAGNRQKRREALAVERRPRVRRHLAARKLLGWPKRCELAHAFRWKYTYKKLKLAQLLGQLGVFLTCARVSRVGKMSMSCVGCEISGPVFGNCLHAKPSGMPPGPRNIFDREYPQ